MFKLSSYFKLSGLLQKKSVVGLLAFIALIVMITESRATDSDHAHIVVRDEIINPDLQSFTATVEAIGNGSQLSDNSGFEPLVFRTMMQTTEASTDRIIAPPNVISNWDTWRTGALDGADVEILRIEEGVFRSVRRDKVAENGHQANGWLRLTPRNRVVSPNVNSYQFSWENWYRPGVQYFFAVSAVDAQGRLTPPKAFAQVMAPETLPRPTARVENQLLEVQILEDDANLEAPEELIARLTEHGTVELSWSSVPEAVGYVVFRADTPPAEHLGYFIALEGPGPVIQAGDLAIIRTRFFEADRRVRLTNRAWGSHAAGRAFGLNTVRWPDQEGGRWLLHPHSSDTAVEQAGETHLRVMLDEGDTRNIGNWNHAGQEQSFYHVLQPGQPYRMDVWMRGQATQPVVFEFTGFYGRGEAQIDPVSFFISDEWQKYSVTFEVPVLHPSRQAGQMRLRLSGPGLFDIDNFRIYRADAEFLALIQEDIERLQSSRMGMLRTHSLIKTYQATYDLSELTNPAGVSNTQGGNTLPQVLEQIDRVGMSPWLQIEPHLTREEWLGFAEYLSAPFDLQEDDANALPWAAKRAAQGFDPWVVQFDRILFEIGNETWNRLFQPWTFPPMTDAVTGTSYSSGTVYGYYQEYVLSILRESPHWPLLENVLEPVIGGWSGSSGWTGFDYGFDAASVSPNSAFVAHAAYNGGWDEDSGPVQPDAEGLFTVLTHVLQTAVQRAERHQEMAERISSARGVPLLVGTYEAGPGYAMNGLNGARVTAEQVEQQELAMKSVAAGTATLDAFLMRAAHGQVLQNFFTYGSGQYWTSHAPWHRGGQTYPAWDLLALFNQEALGDMLAVDVLNGPTVDLEERNRRHAVENGSLISAYATRSGDRLSLIVISRRTPNNPTQGSGNTALTVDLPIGYAESLTVYSQTGDWQSHNVDQQGSFLVSERSIVPSTLPRIVIENLPPGEMLMYVFDGIR